MRIDQLLTGRVVAGHPRRKLSAVLNIQEHPRHQSRDLLWPLRRSERAHSGARQMIDGSNSTLVMQFTHRKAFSKKWNGVQ